MSPDTGVTGTTGALLALVGATAVLLGSLVATLAAPSGWLWTTLMVLLMLGAVLTAIAGYFLMQYGLAVSMALAALAVPAALVFSPDRKGLAR